MHLMCHVLWHEIVPLEYIKKRSLSVHNCTVPIIKDSYTFQKQISHHQAPYARGIKGNFKSLVFIYLKMFSGSYFGLTRKNV